MVLARTKRKPATQGQKRATEKLIAAGKATRWKKGVSGNPAGPGKKDKIITCEVRRLLEADAGNGKTNATIIAEVIVEKLMDEQPVIGYPTLLKDQQDRLEGKVTEEHNINLNAAVNFIIGKGYAKVEDDKGE